MQKKESVKYFFSVQSSRGVAKHVSLCKFWKSKQEALGLSQRVFARKHNYDYSLISKTECVDRRFNSIETVQYYKNLNINPYELIDIILKKT